MENSNGIVIIGLVVMCLIFLGIILFRNPEIEKISVPTPIYINQPQTNQTQPQLQPQPHNHQCPPPVCPPDCRHDDAKRMYMMGYRDSSSGRRPNEFYRYNEYYRRGYRDGAPHCPPQLKFNIILG